MASFLLSIEAKNFCLFRKMEKSEFRVVIKHLYLKGLTPKEIKVLSCRRIKVHEIIDATGILQGTVFSILYEKLGVKKISARWVPRLLSEENKRNRVVDSEAILVLFRRNPDEFLRRYIAVDETWMHHYIPETK